jgi:hypothetical protein
MKRIFLVIIIFSTLFPVLKSQFYSTGEDPSLIKWNKIKTPHFELVFPKNISYTANRLANILEFYYPFTFSDLNSPLKKPVPVLIHQSSVLSNGYVTLAPKRMEIVSTPPQESYAQDWLSQLALHESRHVIQLNSLNRGFTYGLGLLTGQIGRGVVSAQVPSWFYEGDAVYNETYYSFTGRGRSASFEMPLKAILNEQGRNYSYDKSLFGSYRDHVPDQYEYGYQMVKFARANLSDSVWSDILRFTGKNPFLLWPVAIRMKAKYGFFNRGLYKRTMQSLKTQTDNKIKGNNYRKYSSRNLRVNQVYTNYLSAYSYKEGLVTFRTGLNDPGSFVKIKPNGKEQRIILTGTSSVIKYDVYNGQLIWCEIRPDPRWAQRSYSVLKTVNLETGTSRNITKKSRYFSPDFSADGSRIAVAENDINNNNFIAILNAANGKVMQRIAFGDESILTPAWSGNSDIIYITLSAAGKKLESFNLYTRQRSVIIPSTYVDFSNPVAFDNYILFHAALTGTDNIYAVNKKSKQLFQLTHAEFGANYPSTSSDKRSLLFSNYSANGYDIVEMPLDTSVWERLDPALLYPVVNDNVRVYNDSIPAQQFAVSEYRRGLHLFNVHSWLPFYADIDKFRSNPLDARIHPGVMLFSQNLLSTFISSIGWHYENGYNYFHPSIVWKGWYPVFEISADIGGPQRRLNISESFDLPDKSYSYELNFKTFIPLHYTSGKSHIFITPMVEFQRSSLYYLQNNSLRNGLNFLHLRFNLSNIRRLAIRDIYPRTGQTLAFTYTSSILDDSQFGDLFSMQGTFFFPGIFRHHHIFIKGGYQLQQPKKYFLPFIRIDFPRGYQEMVSRELSSARFNYTLPLAYPDLAVDPLVYLKRLRANAFYDISYGYDIRTGTGQSVTGYYRSYGGELFADFHAFRLIFPVSAGIRVGYIPGNNKVFTELLFNIDTGNF